MKTRITKWGTPAQARWLEEAPHAVVPSNIKVHIDCYSYDFVEGKHPTDWRKVMRQAELLWGWQGCTPLEIDVGAYIRYCEERWVPEACLREIRKAKLTPVAMCHGDMTFANAIETRDGDIIFIDPGEHRGLPCRELDEAKILQSLDGFDVVYRGWAQPMAYPKFPTRRIHWALLATHYARLLRHVKHEPSLAFARQRIEEIECGLSS